MLLAFVAAAMLQGTQGSATAILAHAKQAAGGGALASIRTLHYRERVSTLGVPGHGEEWDDVVAGLYVQTQAIGPLSGQQGYDGKNPWSQDATGIAHLTQSSNDVSSAITQAYATSFSYFFPQRLPGTIVFAGKKALGPRTCNVLRALPRGGYPIDLWFDAETSLLDRSVITYSPLKSTTSDFSDFRTVAGVVLPFNIVMTDSQGNEFDTGITSVDVNAPAQMSFAIPKGEPHDFELAPHTTSTTFPIEVVNNHIYLDAKVNGKGPFRFIFDTGGEGILNPDVAASLGVHPAGALQAGGAGAGTVQTGFAWVGKIQLGGATMSHQSFAILPLGPVMQAIEGMHIDGMVGYETVARYLTTIDYAHNTMTLSLPKAGVRPSGVAVPFVFYQTIPQVKAAVDGLRATVEIDTGSRSELTLMSPYVAAHGLAKKYPSPVQGIVGYGIGGPTTAQMTRIKTLSVGLVAVPGVVTNLSTDTKGAMADPSLSGNLGGGVLKRFVVTFDYRNQIMYLQKGANFAHVGATDRSGLVLVATPAGIRVIGVLTSTPAALAGIHSRDLIESVNGTPSEKLGLIRIREMLSGSPGTIVNLTVRSGGAERPIALKLANYV